MKHNIIPMPNKPIILGIGMHTITKNMAVDFASFSPDCVAVFGQRTGITLQTASSDTAELILVKNDSFQSEEYSLTITEDTITVEAATEQGVIWGLTSLYHLIENETIPCLQVGDSPKHHYRGLLLDCARHFFSVEEVKKIIEEISLVKINIFHWHLSDDQGFRVESEVFPQLHQMEGQEYYSKVQIRDIIDYAKQRGIEIIPEIDMPGHTTAIVAAMPHLSCQKKPVAIRKQGGIFRTILCPGKEETYNFATKLLDEVGELFDSSYFHIGGDEASTLEWEICEDCKKLMEENGETEVRWLQSYFTKRVVAHLRKNGKKPIVWNDLLDSPDAIQDIDVQYWIENPEESKLAPFFENGGSTIFSSMPYTYLDYPHCFISLQKIYEFTPTILGRPCDDAPNTKGVECCVWTERISTPERLGELTFPRAYAFGEAAWSNDRDYASFEKRLMPLLAQLTKKGISFTPPEDWSPTGAERRRLIIEFFKMFRESMPEKSDARIVETLEGEEDESGSKFLLLLLYLFEISDPLLVQDLIAAFAPPQQ